MMFAAAAMVRNEDGKTFYEYPDAFTTSQLVFFPVLTEEELKLYQADAIVREGIEELPERRPHVPTVLFSFSDDPTKLKPHFIEGKNVLIDFLDIDDTPRLRDTLTRRPHVPTVLFSFSDDPTKLKPHFIEGKNVLIDFLDIDDTPRLRDTLTRWMRAIPTLRPKSVVVTVMFKNKELIAWKYDDVSKKYNRFA